MHTVITFKSHFSMFTNEFNFGINAVRLTGFRQQNLTMSDNFVRKKYSNSHFGAAKTIILSGFVPVMKMHLRRIATC